MNLLSRVRALGFRKPLVALGAALLSLLAAAAAAQIGDDPAAAQSVLERLYSLCARQVGRLPDLLLRVEIVALVALPFQALWPAVRRRPKVLTYEYWLDVVYWCQSMWLSLLSFYVIAQWIVAAVYGDNLGWFPALAKLPFWVQVVLALWAVDFLVYWRHRLEHAFSVLWSFHAVHHTAEKVDVLTTSRLHPFELLMGALFGTAVVRAGLQPAATALGFAIYLKYNYFIHSNVRIRFPGFLKYVLGSPFMHQWHHATDAAAAGKNLGVVFAWNDWLFGTAYHPKHWPTEFGLSGPPAERVGQSYLRHMLYPLQFLAARLAARRSHAAT